MSQKEFTWGVATAAHQVEGAWLEDGKGLNVWDAFSHTPGKIKNGDTADVACDHYHRYEEDIDLIEQLGVRGYRFSISWARILPQGRGEVNQAGIDFYNRLIDGLLAKGITPFVTLYHWDLPLTLQMENDGWLSYSTAEAFAEYAQVCFNAFGDRVKKWMTFNESWCTAVLGHGSGVFAPGRTSVTEPYLAAHNLMLAHGLAAKAFRDGGYAGQIGIANNCDFREPLTDAPEDQAAAQEALEFFYGWFTDPVVFGDYPAIMRERVGDRLPKFTPEQSELLKGSADFLGLNHYTTHYASRADVDENGVAAENGNGGMDADQCVHLSADPAWPTTSMGWYVVPWGLRKMLNWIEQRYNGLPIYVTENGCSVEDNDPSTAVEDHFRAKFIESYTEELKKARDEDGVNVQGYFCWTLMDNFEWTRGYDMRFGLIFCNFDTLERIPKASYRAYQQLIQRDCAGSES
ncbi:GH1 family beta-glucosidase [Coraliomargarita sp. SDUM461003]|uniref:Beta-glucosidase n=1 Tax=Thalassobacterium maritimum TaxID=3041265 RepID=A0ABU1AP27_9BACT|nr:GH1 family beta-glucosidase [Coraliomargarita sp. SDUM461003]MDQ8205932.1 GH1 family beta-glucosidase [Coraliomargarita sp. SDUM461003]